MAPSRYILVELNLHSIGGVKEPGLKAKAARAGAAEEPKLFAAKPAAGRMLLLVVTGLVGR